MFPLRDTVPRHYPPLVVWSLILINSAIFLFQSGLPPEEQEWLVRHWGLVPARYTDPVWAVINGLDPGNRLPFITNAFLHGGWLHLLGNMWTLWLFGSAVEDRLGMVRFILFYLACALLASVTHYLFNAASQIPAIGASGAIAGIIGAYSMLFPRARIIVLVPVLFLPFFFELPAAVFAGLWYLLQVLQGAGELLAPRLGGGVAWWAHIGGFVAGVALIRFIVPRYRRYHRDQGILGHGPHGERR